MFTPLRALLDGAMGRRPIQESVRVAVVLEAAREAVETVFPNQFGTLIEPTAVRNGAIVLTVRSTIVSQEIHLRGAAFLTKLNERVGTNVVQKIKIRIDTTRPV